MLSSQLGNEYQNIGIFPPAPRNADHPGNESWMQRFQNVFLHSQTQEMPIQPILKLNPLIL